MDRSSADRLGDNLLEVFEDLKRVDPTLLELVTSRVRLKVLTIFLPHPEQMFYVREVTRLVDEEVNAVRRELERQKAIGLLATEERGNRLYYKVRTDFPFYHELLRMIGKTTGFARVLRAKADSLGKVKFATLALRFVQNIHTKSEDVDMLIVGHIHIDKLQELVRAEEQKMGHEINYTVMTEDELSFRKLRNDAFIRRVLSQPQIVVVGDEAELFT